MRDHRIRRAESLQRLVASGPRATRVPRLRLGRARAAWRTARSTTCAPSATSRPLKQRRQARTAPSRRNRARPHALGHPRRRQRAERAPADRLRRRQAGDRPQRDRRELPRAEGSRWRPRGTPSSTETDAEVVVHLIERHYGGDLLEARSQRLQAARGPFRVRGHPPRPPGRARRRRGSRCPLLVGVGERRDVPRPRWPPRSSTRRSRSS